MNKYSFKDLINKYQNLEDISHYLNEIQNNSYGINYDEYLDIIEELFASYINTNVNKLRIETILGEFLQNFSTGRLDAMVFDILNNHREFLDMDHTQFYSIILNANPYNINSIEDVVSSEKIREEDCNSRFLSVKNEKENATPEQLIELIVQKAFNQNYETVTTMYNRYGTNLENLREVALDQSTVEYLQILEILFNKKDVSELIEIYENIEFGNIDYLQVEGILQEQYGSMYSALNYSPFSDKKTPSIMNGIEVYQAPSEFCMTVSSFGGIYNSKDSNRDYKKNWENLNSATISTSFISNNNMSMVPIKDVCFGFCEFKGNELLTMGCRNQFVNPNTLNPQEQLLAGKSEFQRPDKLIENTSNQGDVTVDGENYISNFNELAYRRTDENGNIILPSYVVYFADSNLGAINQDDPIWINSVQAAKDLGIPIVIVDKTRCKEKEFDKEKMIGILKENQPKENTQVSKKLRNICKKLKNKKMKQQKESLLEELRLYLPDIEFSEYMYLASGDITQPPKMIRKDKQTLMNEFGALNGKVQQLFYDGEIGVADKQKIGKLLSKLYMPFVEEAPKPKENKSNPLLASAIEATKEDIGTKQIEESTTNTVKNYLLTELADCIEFLDTAQINDVLYLKLIKMHRGENDAPYDAVIQADLHYKRNKEKEIGDDVEEIDETESIDR